MRDISIDIIRAISMIYVIAIWHLSDYTQTFSLEGTFPYCITVAIMGTFMFVSGFLLKGKYDITGKRDVHNFFKKRFIRIIPLYILAASYYVMVGDMSWWRIVLSVFGFSTFIQPMTNTLWFVEMIILFYLLYPLIWSKEADKILFKASLIYLLAFVFDGTIINIDIRFFYYLPCFVMGMILPQSFFCKLKKSSYLFITELSLFVVITLTLTKLHRQETQEFILLTLIAMLGAQIIVFISSTIQVKFLNSVWGGISYISMVAYMFHRQIIFIIYHIYWPKDGYGRLLFILLVCLPIIGVLSYVIQRIYDSLLNVKK